MWNAKKKSYVLSRLVLGMTLALTAQSLFGAKREKPSIRQQDDVADNWDGAPLISFEARTLFPLYVGAGFQLHASPQLKLGIDFGTTPDPYAETIGTAASTLMNRDDFKPVIKAAFEDSILFRVYLRYAFTDEPRGWGVEMGLAQIGSKSEQNVRDVAEAANLQEEFRAVEALIDASGYRPYVNMKTQMLTLDLLATYDYEIKENIRMTFGGGVAKVLGAEVDLSTDIEQFDSSRTGIALLSLGETELSDGIEQYGISPLLSSK